jgi:hypothetical protein
VSSLPLAEASLQHATDGKDNDGDSQIDEADEIGEVRVVCAWGADGLDNDGDNAVDEDDEDIRCLVEDRRRDADGLDNDNDSTIDEPDENYMIKLIGVAQPFSGSAGSHEKRVIAWLQRSQALMPSVESALYFGDPNADIQFNGNSFLVSGHDVDWSGNPTGISLPGIGVEGSTANVLNALNNNQNTNVVGAGGTPSVASVTVPNPFGFSTSFIDDMITLYSPVCDYHLTDGSTVTGNPEGGDGIDNDGDSSVDEADESDFGTTSAMKITYVQGDVHFSGSNSGAGLLLVDGQLEITGNFMWQGIAVVRGDIRLSGGGTNKHIVGAAYIGEDIINTETNVTIGGNSVIQYSQARIDRLSTALASWRVWAFKEE